MIDQEKLKARRKRAYDNYSPERRAELALYAKEWRKNNLEKSRAYGRRYYHTSASLESKQRKWAASKAWAIAHPEYYKEYAIRNRKKFAAKTSRRRMLIKSRIHPLANLDKIEKIFLETPDGMEVDHIVPISCGGWHHELNLQYLPRSLNRSKRDNMYYCPEGFRGWMDVPMFLLPEKHDKTT